MANVIVLGALDTKGEEYRFVQQLLVSAGLSVTLIDTSVLDTPAVQADITNREIASAGGASLEELIERHDRGHALAVMSRGARSVVDQLVAQGRVSAALALGGTGGTAVASAAFAGIPLGTPKVIVSTAASGHTEQYIGETDLVLMPSITDVAGLNPLLRRILTNAAYSIAGQLERPYVSDENDRPMIGASMFGVTTPAVTLARHLLDAEGFETVVFHMTGIGGRSLEQLVRQNFLAGVFDLTTTELADELLGGVFSAGASRLTAAAATGVPQVVSVGALDMVNFGPRDSVPSEFSGRTLYEHNASVTLMRTLPEECREIGARLAQRVGASTGPAAVFLPLQGVSALSVKGAPFHNEDSDGALFDAIRSGLSGTAVELIEVDAAINDPLFAATMVKRLVDMTNSPSASPAVGRT